MYKKNSRIPKIHIKRGDKVKMLSGNHRNEEHKVLQVMPKAYRAVVEGVNMVSKHRKPSTKNPQGKIEKREAPIHISNLMLVDPATGSATRVGRKRNDAGKLERYSKKSGEFIKNG